LEVVNHSPDLLRFAILLPGEILATAVLWVSLWSLVKKGETASLEAVKYFGSELSASADKAAHFGRSI
jgi:hypothetical protein